MCCRECLDFDRSPEGRYCHLTHVCLGLPLGPRPFLCQLSRPRSRRLYTHHALDILIPACIPSTTPRQCLCKPHTSSRQTVERSRSRMYCNKSTHEWVLRLEAADPTWIWPVTLNLGNGLTCREDWHIPGHDYGRNFTLNICEPVLSDYSDVVRVNDRTNVSGYYVDSHGDKISIG
jgi:hypothetical protein